MQQIAWMNRTETFRTLKAIFGETKELAEFARLSPKEGVLQAEEKIELTKHSLKNAWWDSQVYALQGNLAFYACMHALHSALLQGKEKFPPLPEMPGLVMDNLAAIQEWADFVSGKPLTSSDHEYAKQVGRTAELHVRGVCKYCHQNLPVYVHPNYEIVPFRKSRALIFSERGWHPGRPVPGISKSEDTTWYLVEVHQDPDSWKKCRGSDHHPTRLIRREHNLTPTQKPWWEFWQ
ncbi:MAG: hypothetical protein AAB388_05055 [Patescibacteria group bacterium]